MLSARLCGFMPRIRELLYRRHAGEAAGKIGGPQGQAVALPVLPASSETGARNLRRKDRNTEITGQRLGSASVTRGNVAGSHTPGNNTPETRLRTRSAGQILVRPIAGATTATRERIISKNAARGSVRPAALCRAS